MLEELKSLREPGEHMAVLWVGWKPSKKNINQRIAFIGTKSYSRLLQWVYKLDMNTYNMRIINSTDQEAEILIKSYANSGNAVITLGQEAAKYVESLEVDNFFRMPHPSGLNRQLNNKTELKNLLLECKKYVYSK